MLDCLAVPILPAYLVIVYLPSMAVHGIAFRCDLLSSRIVSHGHKYFSTLIHCCASSSLITGTCLIKFDHETLMRVMIVVGYIFLV